MSLGNGIVLTTPMRGRFEECIISGTPKPGTVMEVKNTAKIQGRFTYEPAGTTAASGSRGMSADGDRIPTPILLADTLQGKLATDAYADGDRGFLYWPVNGDEINVLYQNQSGTADDVAIGDKLIVDDGTGKLLVSTGSVESEPFQALEVVTDPTADQLIHAVYCGQ